MLFGISVLQLLSYKADTMHKISIILPIYDVKEYLDRCIYSVMAQSLQDIEVILATDGPEECDKICQRFASIDPRIKIIFHPGSYGKACNQGIKIASGEYIGFVETDDWCHPQMFEKLYDAAKKNNADVCKGGFFDAFDDETKNIVHLFHKKNESFHISTYPEKLAFQPSIWSAIYKTSFIKKNNITMIEDRMPFIDGPFHMETLINANIITNVAEPLYYYYHDNPKQSVKNEKSSFAGLKAEEFFYKKYNIENIKNDKIRAHIFRATLCHLKWDYERLSSEDNKLDFRNKMKLFFNSIPINTIKSSFIENWLWEWYLFYHEKSVACEYSLSKSPVEYKNFWQHIFYIKNINGFKVMNIFGLKFKLANKVR